MTKSRKPSKPVEEVKPTPSPKIEINWDDFKLEDVEWDLPF